MTFSERLRHSAAFTLLILVITNVACHYGLGIRIEESTQLVVVAIAFALSFAVLPRLVRTP